MPLALIGLILFLVAPIFIGSALAWLRISEERMAPEGSRPRSQRTRDARWRALPPAA